MKWVCEVEETLKGEDGEDFEEGLAIENDWDDVQGFDLNPAAVQIARNEELDDMESKPIWSIRPRAEC